MTILSDVNNSNSNWNLICINKQLEPISSTNLCSYSPRLPKCQVDYERMKIILTYRNGSFLTYMKIYIILFITKSSKLRQTIFLR